MDDRQRRENDRNIRSNDFLTANLADFAANQVAQAKISRLAEKVTKTQQEHQNQIAGEGDIRQDYSIVRDAYDELLDEMRDVRDFANSMAVENPGLENKFRLPRQGGKRGLINAARVFADDALEYKQAFIDYGMEASFIDDLRAKADALEEALAEADASIGDRAGATDTLEQEIKEANKIIEVLDPLVRRIYRTNPAKLTAWIYASHVERHTPKPRPAKPV
jgi:uncharacterized coiled-coil DUF342 family protein